MYKVVLTTLWICNLCNYSWTSKYSDQVKEIKGVNIMKQFKPNCCPRCKSRFWDISSMDESEELYKVAAKVLQHKEELKNELERNT